MIRGEALEIAGIRFWTRRPADIARGHRTGADDPVLLLAHDPRRLTEAAALDVPAVLSGHTHGGQVVLPGLGAVARAQVPGRRRDSASARNVDLRQPWNRHGLRAGANQLSAGSRARHTAAAVDRPRPTNGGRRSAIRHRARAAIASGYARCSSTRIRAASDLRGVVVTRTGTAALQR